MNINTHIEGIRNTIIRYRIWWIVLVFMIIATFFLLKHLYSSIYGVPPGYTGAPLDGMTCATLSCHSGPVSTVNGWISTDIPTSGYLPGDTYNITLTASRPLTQNFGFLMTAHGDFGEEGEFIITDPVETQYSQGTGYITHKPAGVTGNNTKSWQAKWVAPSDTYTIRVDFYAAMVAGVFLLDEAIFLTSHPTLSALRPVTETKVKNGISLHPNPFSDHIIMTSAGPVSGAARIELFNAGGAFLKAWSSSAFSEHQLYMDTESLTPGVYYFRVFVGEIRFTEKMIKY